MSPTPPSSNPFPGLRPFTQEEDYLFFGREEQTLELLQRLGTNRFVAVVGTSGSGKSSLVRCGLLSELLGGRMLVAGASWEIAVTHPGGNPLAILTDALLDADLYDREVENVRENLLATLSRSHFGLVEAVKQAGLGEGTNFLLVVDQFEEIFRFQEAGQRQQEAANEFVSLLLEAVAQKDVPIYVVLTMRSDFIGECGQFEGLAEMVNRAEFLIPRLSRDQYKRVIEGPIKVAGGKIAPRLLQRLLNDLGQQADQLPCLQHALMRTWDVWAAKGDAEALDLDDYQRVGRMSQALSLHADEIFEALATDRERVLCEGIFQALTMEESNSRGIRRPQRLGRLGQILEVPTGELIPIIDAYRRSGVTFLMPSPDVELTEHTIIDISHESLMRVWVRLRQWVEEETQAAGIYHRLSESADLHAQGRAGLYRDPELGIALAWKEVNRPNIAWAERYRPGFETAMAFLDASQQSSVAEEQAQEAARQHELEQAQQLTEAQQLRLEQQQRSAGRLRQLISGLAVVAIFAVVASVIALFSNIRANHLADNARQNEEQAKKNEKRAEESQQETAKALGQVASQKAAVEGSLAKAEAAEENGRKVLYTTDMRLAPFYWRDDRTTAEQLRVLLAKHIPDAVREGEASAQPTVSTNVDSQGGKAGASPSQSTTVAASAKADLRGFEWHYYQHLLNNSGQLFAGHDVGVVDVAFTEFGSLVTLDQNNQVRHWDLATQEEDQSQRHNLRNVAGTGSSSLSPDGKMAVFGVESKVFGMDTATGQELFQISSVKGQVRDLVFSRNSTRLMIVDNEIRWFTAPLGEFITYFDRTFTRVEHLAASEDGSRLVVAGYGNVGANFATFQLDSATKKAVAQVKDGAQSGTIGVAAVSPDGQLIAIGHKLGGTLSIIDFATGRLIAQHSSAHGSPLSAITYSPDGKNLVTGDTEGTLKVWPDTRRLTSKTAALQTLKGHRGAIKSVRFSADGRQLASASEDRTARVWNLATARASIRRLAGTGASAQVSFSPDGQLMAASTGNAIRLWEVTTGQCVRELPEVDQGRITSVAFSPTDSRLLAAGYSGWSNISYIVLWDIDSGTELARLPGESELSGNHRYTESVWVGALAFSPDGKYLAIGFGSPSFYTGDKLLIPVKVYDVATRKLIRTLNGHTNYCVSLAFSKDGTKLASGNRDGTSIIWSTATWQPLHTLADPDKDSGQRYGRGVEAVAISPDSRLLAMANNEGHLHLWDLSQGQLLETLKGHSSAVHALAFTPDGRSLASGSNDYTVRLWNVSTRRELLQLDSGNIDLGEIQSLTFSPDGQNLLVGGRNGAACWFAAPSVWEDTTRATATLSALLNSNADFSSRIQMLSENLRLHAALEKLNSQDPRVQAALAATQANWHASRRAWPEAVAALDRLRATKLRSPEDWLRTPGLLKLATALVHQNRAADAAALLAGGARRRKLDGLPAIEQTGLGFTYEAAEGAVRVTELLPEYPGSLGGLRSGDTIVKIDDHELTVKLHGQLRDLMEGEPGTKVQLTVRHPDSEQLETIELTRERFVNDVATGTQLRALREAVDERLVQDLADAGLLSLRAELSGQWSDQTAQIADYTAAIEALAGQTTPVAARELPRLYAARGNAYVTSKQWQKALDDYAHAVTDKTTDDILLTNQAQAQAEILLAPQRWTILKPTEFNSWGGAALTLLPDDSILASGKNPLGDSYSLVADTQVRQISVIRLEGLTHESLPKKGPGRDSQGNRGVFAMTEFKITAQVPGSEPIPLEVSRISADHFYNELTMTHWNNTYHEGNPVTATYLLKQPVDASGGVRLKFDMRFSDNRDWPGQNLGHFRLSVSDDPAAGDLELKRLAILKLTDPWQKLAAAYRLIGNQNAITELIERRPQLAGQVGDMFVQDKNWQRAVEVYSMGLKARAKDIDLLSKRARANEALKDWNAASEDWTSAAVGNPEGQKLLAGFSGRLVDNDQALLARALIQKSRTTYEQALQADPGNNVIAGELADLLLSHTSDWTILQPTQMTSEGGATLTRLEDSSILASGTNPDRDRYTVIAKPELKHIRAIRVEAIPDPSLPENGPGRHANGNFHLSNLQVFSAGAPSRLSDIAVTWSEGADYRNLIDRRNTSTMGWGVYTRHERQAAVIAANIVRAPADDLRLELICSQAGDLRANLGRFRLSVTDDVLAFRRLEYRTKSYPDAWSKLAAAYALNGQTDEAARYLNKALQQASGFEPKKQILELALPFEGLLTELAKQNAKDQLLQLILARSLVERGQQKLTANQPAQAQVDFEKAREVFNTNRAQLARWTVLAPIAMRAESGRSMEIQPDGSVFVHQFSPTQIDNYSLDFQTPMKGITGLRLEVLGDPRLPHGGPGWNSESGTFELSELTLQVNAATAQGSPRSIELQNPWADVSQGDYWDIRGVVDGRPQTTWSTGPQPEKDHTAVFDLAEPVGDGQETKLTIRLAQNKSRALLGRFRLAITNDPIVLQTTRSGLAVPDRESAGLDVQLAKACALQGHLDQAVDLFAAALKLTPDRAGKTSIVAAAAPFTSVLEKVAAQAAGDGLFQYELALHYANRGDGKLAAASRATARRLYEQQLAKQPDNSLLAQYLADCLVPPIANGVILPTSEPEAVTWRFTTAAPPADWATEAFDDSTWATAAGGFRGDSVPGNFPGNKWTTPDIWMRHTFDWKLDPAVNQLVLRLRYDDHVEVLLNGKQVHASDMFQSTFQDVVLGSDAASLLKPGANTLAVHCWSTYGEQYIDLGLSASTVDRAISTGIADPWARLAACYHLAGDLNSAETLVKQRPAAASGLGDIHAGKREWDQAIVEYDKAIGPDTTNASLFVARALAHEKLEHWEAAAEDWGSVYRFAPDKRARYGLPSFPAMERRGIIHTRLQQWEKVIADYTELLKPEGLGELPWFYSTRGVAYHRLRQWDKARADFDQAVKVAGDSERSQFLLFRGVAFAAEGDWKLAADDVRTVYQKPTAVDKEWWRCRDASLIFLMSGDVDLARQTARECYRIAAEGNSNQDDCKWTVLVMCMSEDQITSDVCARLLEMAQKQDDYWRPRLKAAIHFRNGEYQQAADIYDVNDPGPQFWFLAASNYQKLGKLKRARQLLDQGNNGIRRQVEKNPKLAIPEGYTWQDWVTEAGLQQEANTLILGELSGDPTKLAQQGQTMQAASLFAKALASAPDEAARLRIIDAMRPFYGMTTAAYVLNRDWKNAAASDLKRVETGSDSVAWMVPAALSAYGEDPTGHRQMCQRMFERFQKSATEGDIERYLKVMALLPHGPEMPAEFVNKFKASCETVSGHNRVWFLSTRALIECRAENFAEARNLVDQVITVEKEASDVKLLALAIKSLTYARQKDAANARKSLDELKQFMKEKMNLTWGADGRLDNRSLLSGTSINHDKMIPDTLRREVEQLIKSAN